jgi:DNA-directed RNA polymerase specialized sigma24 family protein
MAERSREKKPRWTLAAEAFDALLAGLDPDRARAGERYELLRHKLVQFFEWKGASDAERWADETINRVARRIEEGVEVLDVPRYAAGVARMIWLEAAKQEARVVELDERTPAPATEERDSEPSLYLACLRSCLETLPTDQRQLMLEYFEDDRGAKIDSRKQIAARLGIEMNALRLRVFRISAKLEPCVRDCVAGRKAPK